MWRFYDTVIDMCLLCSIVILYVYTFVSLCVTCFLLFEALMEDWHAKRVASWIKVFIIIKACLCVTVVVGLRLKIKVRYHLFIKNIWKKGPWRTWKLENLKTWKLENLKTWKLENLSHFQTQTSKYSHKRSLGMTVRLYGALYQFVTMIDIWL